MVCGIIVLPLSGQVDTQPLEEVMTPSPTATKPVEVTPEKAQSSMSVTRMFVFIHVNIKDIGICIIAPCINVTKITKVPLNT